MIGASVARAEPPSALAFSSFSLPTYRRKPVQSDISLRVSDSLFAVRKDTQRDLNRILVLPPEEIAFTGEFSLSRSLITESQGSDLAKDVFKDAGKHVLRSYEPNWHAWFPEKQDYTPFIDTLVSPPREEKFSFDVDTSFGVSSFVPYAKAETKDVPLVDKIVGKLFVDGVYELEARREYLGVNLFAGLEWDGGDIEYFAGVGNTERSGLRWRVGVQHTEDDSSVGFRVVIPLR
tara:strand:- start:1433 stop:2134 length:702 start_codon:yes stop_codon:yes gene_type:complete